MTLQKNKKYYYILLLFLILSIGTYVIFMTKTTFYPNKILKNSIFKEREFSKRVQEIISKDNQISAFLIEEHSVPLVSVTFSFKKAGYAYEKKVGSALLVENILLDGTENLNRKEMRDYTKDNGIKTNVNINNDKLLISLSFVKNSKEKAKQLLKDILYAPRLANEDIILKKNQLKMIKKRQQENPEYQLRALIKETLYNNHPYGKPDIPSEQLLKEIEQRDLITYLKDSMTKETLSIGIAGDITPSETQEFITDVFDKLPQKDNIPSLNSIDIEKTDKETIKDFTVSSQSFGLWLTYGIKRLDTDFYPLYIANYVFGGSGLNSRLNQKIREKEGLTYGIYSYLTNSDSVDLWQIFYSATPNNVIRIRQIVDEEYEHFYTKGITTEELQRAKDNLLSGFNLRFSSLTEISAMLEQMMSNRLGRDFLEKRQDYIKSVTVNDVNTAIKKHLVPNLNQMRYFEIKGKLNNH